MPARPARLQPVLVSLISLFLPAIAGPVLGQATQQPPGYHLSAGARIVLTDVTVTDAKGNRVGNLPASAFTITDDGEPQKLSSFTEHTEPIEPQANQPSAATHGTFDNALLAHPPAAVNVLLIDIKNLEVVDQLYLRFQLLKLLKSLPENALTAVYWCRGPETVLLQDFTPNPTLLTAAINKALPRFPPSGNIFYDDYNTLHQLAASLAQLPARKNILWFTGGSTQLLASPDGITHMAYGEAEKERRIYDELEAGRLTLYPIDARALVTSGYNKDSVWAQHQQMNDIAYQTGGQAFFNTNGLEIIADRILHADGNFYTLTYAPQDFHADGKWHKVNVELTLPNGTFHLSYRRGYFADPADGRNKAGPASPGKTLFTLKGAPDQDPDSRTQPILFTVQPLPSTGPTAPHAAVTLAPDPAQSKHGMAAYMLHYTLPLDAFTIQDAGSHPKAELGFAVLVFNDTGNISSRRAQELTLSIRKDKIPLPAGETVTIDQPIALPTGDTSLYCAVWDIVTHRVGTVQIPLEVRR